MRARLALFLEFSGLLYGQTERVEALNTELRRIAGESPEKAAAVRPAQDIRQAAASRAEALLELIRRDPRRALDTALPATTLAKLRALAPDLENSQCALDLAEVDYYTSGNELRVRIPLRFKDSFAGARAMAAFVVDYSEAATETQAGAWTVGPATEPTPAISADSVVNAASPAGNAVAPGELVAIYGTGLGPPEIRHSWYEGVWLRGMVADTEVFFDGVRAPLIYTVSGQLAAIVPYFVSGRSTLRVEYQGRRSNEIELPVADCAPGIFTANSSGSGPAVAVNERGGLNSAENPAERRNPVVLDDGRGPGPAVLADRPAAGCRQLAAARRAPNRDVRRRGRTNRLHRAGVCGSDSGERANTTGRADRSRPTGGQDGQHVEHSERYGSTQMRTTQVYVLLQPEFVAGCEDFRTRTTAP